MSHKVPKDQNIDRRLFQSLHSSLDFLSTAPLGIAHSARATRFRLYAPQAETVTLLLAAPPAPQISQEEYLGAALESPLYQDFVEKPRVEAFAALLEMLPDYSELSEVCEYHEVHALERQADGVFQLTLPGNYFAWRYRYRLGFPEGRTVETVDPYAKLTAGNGQAGVIADAEGLDLPIERPELQSRNLARDLIYELHVRDFSIRPNTVFQYPGTFLAFCEEGVENSEGQAVGLAHLRGLGVTHLELLPIYQTATLDECSDLSFNRQYNWGYDPAHYFAIEGAYSTAPRDPFRRLLELKFMTAYLRQQGIAVVMDVVFNHVYDILEHPLELTEPGQCFRFTEEGVPHDGSYCGNETCSENPYYRRYMRDCLVYWQEQFGLGGFRFDLMGLHDVESLEWIARELLSREPELLLFGEGWVMGNHPEGILPANEQNARKMPHFGFFNDSFRDLVRGALSFDTAPSLEGRSGRQSSGEPRHQLLTTEPLADSWTLYNNLLGAQHVKPWLTARQNIAYLACHDNRTLRDRIMHGNPDLSPEELKERLSLGQLLLSLCHGRLFLHGGQDFARSKGGIDNSYNQPDVINALDWTELSQQGELQAKLQSMMTFRRKRESMEIENLASLATLYRLEIADPGRLAYQLRESLLGEGAVHLLVLINLSPEPWRLEPVPGYTLRLDSALGPSSDKKGGSSHWILPPWTGRVYTQPRSL